MQTLAITPDMLSGHDPDFGAPPAPVAHVVLMGVHIGSIDQAGPDWEATTPEGDVLPGYADRDAAVHALLDIAAAAPA